MKKIIISLSIIAAAALIVIGGTTAFFSDTETSIGNTFTAGKFDLQIDSTCHYDGMVCTASATGAPYQWKEETTGSSRIPELLNTACACTWGLNAFTGQPFFNFTDVKPGDDGENTVSLHIDNNPAWVCAQIANLANAENGCNGPESAVDTTCGTSPTDPGVGLGELQNNIYFDIWKDTDCDNVKDAGEDYLIQNAKVTDSSWPLFDSSNNGTPLPGGSTTCLGVSWSVPPEVNNIIQTDSVSADVIFSAVQSRNNPDFLCGPPPEGKGTLIVIKHVINDNGGSATAGNWTMNITDTNPSNNHFAGAESPGVTITLDAGSYSVDESNGPAGYAKSASAECSGTIAAGDTKTCTITNNDNVPQLAQLTIIKHVINDNGGSATAGNWTMNITDTNPSNNHFAGAESPGVTITLDPGTFSVDESGGPSGYSESKSTDCSGTIAAGVPKTCTITNDDIQPLLTVTKIVNGGLKQIADFPLFVDATSVISGVQNGFNAGAYTVSETPQGTYVPTISGNCASDGSITLALGDVKSCTITNACFDQADVMLVLDKSASIDSTELGQLKTAALAFVTALNPDGGVHMGQTSFSTTGSLDQHLTGNQTLINAAINGLATVLYTNLYEGIHLANLELADSNTPYERPTVPDFMIVITDGNPNRPSPDSNARAVALAEATAAKAAGVTIYVVGVGSDVNTAYLTTIASPSKYYSISNYSGLQAALAAIATCQ